MNRYLLNASINAEKDMLARCRNALKGLPRGGLTSYLRNGRLYYKRNEAGEQKYLGTESNPMVNKLKKRHLLEKMIDILENNIPLHFQMGVHSTRILQYIVPPVISTDIMSISDFYLMKII
ncbi:MAG: hypothetical protein IJI25_04075 [Eubacterium sp.]|nr:hypothetical protein [Eubacterium sp.]